MTDDEQAKMVATIGAHDALLSFLLSDYLRRCTPEQREQLRAEMDAPAPAGQMPKLTDDLDTADRLAGLAMGIQGAVRRIIGSATKRLDR